MPEWNTIVIIQVHQVRKANQVKMVSLALLELLAILVDQGQLDHKVKQALLVTLVAQVQLDLSDLKAQLVRKANRVLMVFPVVLDLLGQLVPLDQ